MDTFKVIIAGGRDYADYPRMVSMMDAVLASKLDDHVTIEIVSGMAKGADTLGEQYADESGFKVAAFYAKWDTFGKSAGYKRNEQMAEYADALVAFWNGNTTRSGTFHMINIARERRLPVRVARY